MKSKSKCPGVANTLSADSKVKESSVKDVAPGDRGLPVVCEGMEAWQTIGLGDAVIRGLHECGFKEPTPVQQQAIPLTLQSSGDVIGAAETVRTAAIL